MSDDSYSYTPYIPYIPSPNSVVKKMLEIAKVGENDVVYDLGAGDGRVIIMAIKEFNAKKAVGIEINDERVQKIIENIKKARLHNRAFVIRGNFFEIDISEATVITLFLLTDVNEILKPKLEKELKPGTRIISHEFEIPGWKAEQVESVQDERGIRHMVYLYLVQKRENY